MPKTIKAFVAVGSRGDGKSTSVKWILEHWVVNNPGRKFLYLVRLDEEVKLKKKKLKRYFTKFNVEVEGYEIYKIERETYVTKNGNTRTKTISKEFIGEIQALNNSSKMRSGEDYVNEGFDFIFWDEFCEEKGKNLAGEFSLLKSIMETVFRDRQDDKMQTWLVSNEVDRYNPVFQGLKCPDNLGSGQVYIDTEQGFAYYRLKTSAELLESKKDSFSYKFGKDSDYNKFAHHGEWKIENSTNIVPEPSGPLKEHCNVIYLGNIYGVWKVGNKWRIAKNLCPNGKTYPLSKQDGVNYGIPYQGHSWFYSIVNGANTLNNIEYQDPIIKETMAAFVARNR